MGPCLLAWRLACLASTSSMRTVSSESAPVVGRGGSRGCRARARRRSRGLSSRAPIRGPAARRQSFTGTGTCTGTGTRHCNTVPGTAVPPVPVPRTYREPRLSMSISCPPGFTAAPNGLKCYGGVGANGGLRECERACAANNASLPCVLDAVDNVAVVQIAQHTRRPVFVGRYQSLREQARTVRTTSGWHAQAAAGCQSSFTNWALGEPDDFGCREESCAVANAAGRSTSWFDAPCSIEFLCVCEYPGVTSTVFKQDIPRLLQRSGERLSPRTGCSLGRIMGSVNLFGGPMLLFLLLFICIARSRRQQRAAPPTLHASRRSASTGNSQGIAMVASRSEVPARFRAQRSDTSATPPIAQGRPVATVAAVNPIMGTVVASPAVGNVTDATPSVAPRAHSNAQTPNRQSTNGEVHLAVGSATLSQPVIGQPVC